MAFALQAFFMLVTVLGVMVTPGCRGWEFDIIAVNTNGTTNSTNYNSINNNSDDIPTSQLPFSSASTASNNERTSLQLNASSVVVLHNDDEDSNNNNNNSSSSSSSNETTTTSTVAPGPKPLFTKQQVNILSFLHYTSAPLSLVGSFLIIKSLLLLNWRQKRSACPTSTSSSSSCLRPPGRRLMLGLSTCDLITSLNWAFMVPWASPKDQQYYVAGASGNFTTCSVSGFLINFQLGAGLYTVFLALFFLSQVRFEMRSESFATWVEPWFHFLAIAAPLATGIYATIHKFMNPVLSVPGVCWVGQYPDYCGEGEVECIRGNTGDYYLFSRLLGSGVIGLCFLVILVSMILLVMKVYQLEQRMQQYALGASTKTTTSSGPAGGGDNPHSGSLSKLKRTKAAGVEALLYIGAYLLSFFPMVLLQIHVASPEHRTYFFVCGIIFRFLNPLQGFMNFLVHFRKSGASTVGRPTTTSSAVVGASQSNNNNSRSLLPLLWRSLTGGNGSKEEEQENGNKNPGTVTIIGQQQQSHDTFADYDYSEEASWTLRNLQRSSFLFGSSQRQAGDTEANDPPTANPREEDEESSNDNNNNNNNKHSSKEGSWSLRNLRRHTSSFLLFGSQRSPKLTRGTSLHH